MILLSWDRPKQVIGRICCCCLGLNLEMQAESLMTNSVGRCNLQQALSALSGNKDPTNLDHCSGTSFCAANSLEPDHDQL
jgi:hypothetical protein